MKGHNKNQNKFNEDFKRMVVELYQSGTPVKQLTSEYGVSDVSIYNWVKKFSPVKFEDGTVATADDYTKIQKELRRLQEENENLKKGYGHIREKVSQSAVASVIDQHKDQHPIQTMCEVLELPRSSYYLTLQETESKRERENKELTKRIKEIHEESKGRYGAPKIHQYLCAEGYRVSLKRVQRLMKKEGIRSIVIKKYRPTPSKETVIERENILARDFSTTTINEKWVADITYIHTLKDGWCYLASVMDLHSKKIVGYSFSCTMTTDLVIKALDNAYATQLPPEELILHSDLGSQYTSEAFMEEAESKKIRQSFSRKGCPYDNACIESFHAILKKEEIHHVTYLDYASAKIHLFQYIEGWYNRKRMHGSLQYKTPQQVEDEIRVAA
ncbi:MAG TPA: IS3 family transposase [Bacillus bacterium]|nr:MULTISPECIES: IS3 family transposase [Bacillaceae]MEC1772647.1 IS3 family transposase [Schinkia azotoformans]MED4368520.1 IS3 family transposase [Schinkia azotoformans]HBZ09314.1 IS3 family transposase [Bacillus sp. (in: firmicutes)]